MRLNTISIAKPARAIARAEGRKFYTTGEPCKNGHTAERRVADASCTACRVAYREDRGRRENQEYQARRRSGRTAEEHAAEKLAQNAAQRERRLRDPERIRALERHHSRLKRQRHPQRKLAEVRARQAALIQRRPAWADLKKIREFYENCPRGYEVDHVIPLRGKSVCGLHVENNLQYLTKAENRAKGNRVGDLT